MAVVVGKNDELLFFLEESAIGELNSNDQFLVPLEYTFIYNLHDSSLHESLFHFNMQCNKLNEKRRERCRTESLSGRILLHDREYCSPYP